MCKKKKGIKKTRNIKIRASMCPQIKSLSKRTTEKKIDIFYIRFESIKEKCLSASQMIDHSRNIEQISQS